MAENRESPEQIQSPFPASAEVIREQIKRGEYGSAYEYSKKTDLSDKEWENLSKNIDTYALPENKAKKLPLNPKEFEDAQKENLYKQIDEYGVEHNPTMRFVNRTENAVSESQQIINELLELIQKAKDQAGNSRESHKWGVTVFPVIGSIYGLIKSKRFKTNLKKIENLYGKLNNGQLYLPPTLKADSVSPALGQGKQLTGITGSIAGGILLGPLGALPGAITALYGKFQSFNSFENTGKTYEDLERLENELIDLQNQTRNTENTCSDAHAEYCEGAAENLRNLSAA
jgi:hypothetical protein